MDRAHLFLSYHLIFVIDSIYLFWEIPPPPCPPPDIYTKSLVLPYISWIIEFQTARLILSHLGFLSIPALRGALDSPVPRLVALENDSAQFVQDLENLDRLRKSSKINHQWINNAIYYLLMTWSISHLRIAAIGVGMTTLTIFYLQINTLLSLQKSKYIPLSLFEYLLVLNYEWCKDLICWFVL